ncbi:MAG: zinc-binding dehydrogenase [Bacteroidetes bacterium]|nr:zinc-binding dehydrogenase [Bacteroidota bacterium]
MKKVVYRGIRDVSVADAPEANPGRGEVKIKIKYCGICGSDLHEYLHGPFPKSPFGHEACGEIVTLGEGVKDFAVSERVCSVVPGSFAEFISCPVERVLKIPADMDWKRAAVIEPLSGAAYALERAQIKGDETVLIAGCGTVGLMILLGLKAMGVKNIYMSDLLAYRREKAMGLGATQTWNPREIKTSAKIKELTNGRGADIAIEAVGIEATLKDCLSSVKFGGKVIVQGIFTERALVHMLGFVTRETTMIGTNSINPQLALSWIKKGDIRPESVVTKIIPLGKIKEDGFEILAGKSTEDIKILIAP